MRCSLLIHSPTAAHLGCFQVLAIMNKDAVKASMCKFLCRHKFSTSLGKCRKAWLLDRVVGFVVCSLVRLPKLSSKVAALFCLPASNKWRVPVAPQPCQHLVLSVFWIWAIMMLNIFSYVCHPCIFFGEVSTQVFLNWFVHFLTAEF